MLVLKRKSHEKIVIDGNITVTVLKVEGNSVRIGIDAPPEVPILRGELQEKMKTTPESISKKRKTYIPRKSVKVPMAICT